MEGLEGSNTIADNIFIDEIEEVGPSENVVELEPCNIQCNEGGEVANARKRRRMTSVVWGYFEMLPKPKDGAHIVNLIVQDGLKEIDSSVIKIRESIKYVKGSQVRKQKFVECIKQSCLEGKRGLRQDVPTRWNSTFIMLDSAIYYRRAFQHLELGDSNYKNCPTSVELDKVESIWQFLAPFYEITCVISGSKYPTSNLYFPCISTAYASLKHELLSGHEYIKKMAAGMLVKFEKYWSGFSIILVIAIILDPRYKFAFVEWCYRKLYEGQHTRTSRNVEVGTSRSTSTSIVKSQFIQDFQSFHSEIGMPRKSELELYLDEPNLDAKIDLDILQFWKGNQYRFPAISVMARDVFCIPIITVASEIVHDTELDAVTDDILDLHVTQTDAEMTESSVIR
ncbi:hypothetical protein KFK09_021738 [Dendrobium nobile]|uniref:Zinc finger BED domain-containing protein RICESLEEPER 2-like n=1 Tax=Dendrobium nobile TaxID=94219 RepID=A0A8T3AGK5_DENNO|nr:hypothetical protein KFK09_021738 [Dendrobium nobile]